MLKHHGVKLTHDSVLEYLLELNQKQLYREYLEYLNFEINLNVRHCILLILLKVFFK